jgi:hypothetical protein
MCPDGIGSRPDRDLNWNIKQILGSGRSSVVGHQSIPMMRSVMLILGCCLALILRKGKWNELTGHLKDPEKNRLNSRTNSLQPGENDADRHPTIEDCPDSYLSCLDP